MDSLNPEAMLGWRERIGYGIGSIGTSVIFAALTGFLLIYLTNVAFLDIADHARRKFHLDVTVSTFLEDHATPAQKSRGIDLVDYLYK